MSWNENLTALNQILPGFYRTAEQSARILTIAGIPLAFVNLSGSATEIWYAALVEADKRGKVAALVRAALADYPDDPSLLRALEGTLTPELGESPAEDSWRSNFEASETERLMEAQSTLLPISFLQKGLQAAKSVALVKASTGNGTGFLIGGNLLVTNNHVIPSAEVASSALITFGYEQTESGADAASQTYSLIPGESFETSPESSHDWTIVAVKGEPNSKYGALALAPEQLPLDDELHWVNIIQHPMGGPKAIALYHNLVTYHDTNYVLYMTDTQPGSSGAPVFDSEWRLVALHRGFKYVKDPGKWQRRAYRNWGTAIARVAQRDK